VMQSSRAPSEADIQSQICGLLSHLARAHRFIFFSVPNEHNFNESTGNRFARVNALKKRGMTPGVADLVLVKDGKAYFMEVKTPAGRISDAQRQFMSNAAGAGARYVVVRSYDQAVAVLKQWGIA